MSSVDDLTTRARIRMAALQQFAAHGTQKATLRDIAAAAGVSPALILHHFGSKDGLRQACDDYLIEFTFQEKTKVLTTSSMPALKLYLADHPQLRPLYDYLRRTLTEGGPIADAMFTRMVEDTESYLAAGEAVGAIRPTSDPRARAVLLTAMSAGLLAFDAPMSALLGGTNLFDDAVMNRYSEVSLDLFTYGLMTRPITLGEDES